MEELGMTGYMVVMVTIHLMVELEMIRLFGGLGRDQLSLAMKTIELICPLLLSGLKPEKEEKSNFTDLIENVNSGDGDDTIKGDNKGNYLYGVKLVKTVYMEKEER